jgi:hypothetical protein
VAALVLVRGHPVRRAITICSNTPVFDNRSTTEILAVQTSALAAGSGKIVICQDRLPSRTLAADLILGNPTGIDRMITTIKDNAPCRPDHVLLRQDEEEDGAVAAVAAAPADAAGDSHSDEMHNGQMHIGRCPNAGRKAWDTFRL